MNSQELAFVKTKIKPALHACLVIKFLFCWVNVGHSLFLIRQFHIGCIGALVTTFVTYMLMSLISHEADTHHLIEELCFQLRVKKTVDKLLRRCAGDGSELVSVHNI